MANEEEPLALRSLALGEQMPGSADGIGQRHPARRESERGKLRLEQPSYLPDAREVERAAVDVDGLLQEGDLLRLVGANVVADLPLGRREGAAASLGERRRRRRKEDCQHDARARESASRD